MGQEQLPGRLHEAPALGPLLAMGQSLGWKGKGCEKARLLAVQYA